MIRVVIPGRDNELELSYLLLDMNGTLTTDGILIPGVKDRIELLRTKLKIFLLTADTFGSGAQVAAELGIELAKVSGVNGGEDKRTFIRELGAGCTAAIGNGFNDVLMLEDAALSVAVIGREGCHSMAIFKADIVVSHIIDALDLLVNPLRLIATLRY